MNVQTPTIFAKLIKVDEEKRLVFGRLAEEAVDKADEIMDYMSSKPHFEKWSADIAADTGGKNLGNVRAMHGKVAAGGLTAINFDDAHKVIDVCAKISDDNEWKKVLAGVYTGFSVGGKYVEGSKKMEKMDGREVTRYTAMPSEASLVDRPCMKGAKFFEVQKADGSMTKVDFVDVTADELEVEGTAEEVAALAKLMKTDGLTMADVLKKIAKRPDVDPKEATPGGDYADPTNKKYPLDDAEHVRAAASYFGMAKNRAKYSAEDQKAIDAKIAAAKTKFGIGDDAAATEKFATEHHAALAKKVSFVGLLDTLDALVKTPEYQALADFDESLPAAVAVTGEIIKALIATNDLAKADDATKALATRAEVLAKFEGDAVLPLLKLGARNSKADLARLQAMHDHATALGAQCPMPDDGDDAADPAKVAAARDLLKVSVSDPDSLAKKTDAEIIKLAKALTLQKKEEADRLQKIVDEATAPLRKLAEEQAAKITKLEAQPAATTVRLRAVAKADEMDPDATPEALAKREEELSKPLVDTAGETHVVAGLIKSLHAKGGVSLTAPQALR